jgi:hypothetical protein
MEALAVAADDAASAAASDAAAGAFAGAGSAAVVGPEEAHAERTKKEAPNRTVFERFIKSLAWVEVAGEKSRGGATRQRPG